MVVLYYLGYLQPITMAQPPDLEHKRKREAEDFGQPGMSQPIVPQPQGAFFLSCWQNFISALLAPLVRLQRSWQIQWARLDRTTSPTILLPRSQIGPEC